MIEISDEEERQPGPDSDAGKATKQLKLSFKMKKQKSDLHHSKKAVKSSFVSAFNINSKQSSQKGKGKPARGNSKRNKMNFVLPEPPTLWKMGSDKHKKKKN